MANNTTRRAKYDILSGGMVNNLLRTIRSYGVTFNLFMNKSNEFDFTSLMGTEKIKLLDNLPDRLNDCQPEKFSSLVQKIWKVQSNFI